MIAVLTGGSFSEREPSLATAERVCTALHALGKEFVRIDLQDADWEHILDELHPDVALIAMHGTFAEDGQLQTILEQKGIPFTGSAAEPTKLAFDKRACKKVVQGLGITIASELSVESAQKALPVIVKPNADGSSVGLSIVDTEDALQAAVANLEKRGAAVLIEEYVQGLELTIGIIEVDGVTTPLPPVQIEFPGQTFDFAAKYTPGAAIETCPAPVDAIVLAELEKQSLKAFSTLSLRQYARFDWILRDGKLFFLEVNTLPGMTPTSLIIKELAAAGITFEHFLSELIRTT